jgi:uncharacterized protein YodC (DUF2158 family)
MRPAIHFCRRSRSSRRARREIPQRFGHLAVAHPYREALGMFKVGDVVRLKSGGALMTVSKLFKSPEGREMVQCTWFDKPKEHRAAFVIDSLEAADEAAVKKG